MNKAKTPTLKNWDKHEIQDALARVGLNQAAIARDLGLTPITVSYVVSGKSTSRRVHQAIAEAIGRDVKEIWPTKYLHGDPRPGRRQTHWHRKAA